MVFFYIYVNLFYRYLYRIRINKAYEKTIFYRQMFFSTFNYISINLISHTNVGKDRNETGSVLMNEKEIFVLGCASHVSKGHVHSSKTGSSSSGIGDNSATVKQAESATVNRPLL